jgi:hypothetical protein
MVQICKLYAYIVIHIYSHIYIYIYIYIFQLYLLAGLDCGQPRTQGICSWGAKYSGMVWSRDPRILRKMAYCLLGSGE